MPGALLTDLYELNMAAAVRDRLACPPMAPSVIVGLWLPRTTGRGDANGRLG